MVDQRECGLMTSGNGVTMLKDYGEVKRSAEDRVTWRAITRQPST